MSSLSEDLRWRGLIQSVTDEALHRKLDEDKLTVYIGFDPTATSLHVGSLLQLMNLARLQRQGHKPIVLAGGSTGLIGDPSFKASERRLLDQGTLAENIAGIQPQLEQFLDFRSPTNGAVRVNNFDWTKDVSVLDFLRDVGKHFTINQMIVKESVRARLDNREQGISFTEFSYSLLQAFDFWHLYKHFDCRLQMGASDQWGNIVAGVDLVRRREGVAVDGLCSPLVTKADGTKFGKTESGTVWLDARRTSPYQFHQFFLRSEDAVVVQYLKYFTFLTREEITQLELDTNERPRERRAQNALADAVTTLVHGAEETGRARNAAQAFFGSEIAELDEKTLLDVLEGAPSVRLPRTELGSVSIVDALVRADLVKSKANARTAIEQGGASINNQRVTEVDRFLDRSDLLHDRYLVLRRGKKEFALVDFG